MAAFVLDSSSFGPIGSSNSISESGNNSTCYFVTCRHCCSPNLTTDWKSGDVICTECGAVAEERIRDASPEWRDYQNDDNNDNTNKNNRCGMIANDETRWIGGLEPTTLSTQTYTSSSSTRHTPSSSSESSLSLSKRLKKAHLKVDKLIEKAQKGSFEEADIARQILAKRRQRSRQQQQHQSLHGEEEQEEPTTLDTITETVDLEEFNTNNIYAHQKWSLDYALLLHDYEQQQQESTTNYKYTNKKSVYQQQESETTTILKHFTPIEKRNLRDLFTCYTLIQSSIQALSLPNSILQKTCASVCQYATQTNGLHIRGITSTKEETSTSSMKRVIHKFQQMGALVSALVYIHAKRDENLISTSRSLTHVCSIVNELCQKELSSTTTTTTSTSCVLPKTCSKAITELKVHLPDLFYISSITTNGTMNCATTATIVASSTTSSSVLYNNKKGVIVSSSLSSSCAAANLVQHSTVNILKLSEEASVIIRHLANILGKEQSTKPTIICIAITYFVCSAGSIMQRLARQAISPQQRNKRKAAGCNTVSSASSSSTTSSSNTNSAAENCFSTNQTKHTTTITCDEYDDDKQQTSFVDDDSRMSMYDLILPVDNLKQEEEEEVATTTLQQQQWYEWTRQGNWDRDFITIERAYCGGKNRGNSRAAYEYYKTLLFPRRFALLEMASEALIVNNRRRSNIMTNLATAAPLMMLPKNKLK